MEKTIKSYLKNLAAAKDYPIKNSPIKNSLMENLAATKDSPIKNPSIFLWLKIIEAYGRSHKLNPFSLDEFEMLKKEASQILNGKDEGERVKLFKIYLFTNQKGGSYSSIVNDDVVEIQFNTMKKLFVAWFVIIAVFAITPQENLYYQNQYYPEHQPRLRPAYTFLLLLFSLHFFFSMGYLVEGAIILFGRRFGLFINIVRPDEFEDIFDQQNLVEVSAEPGSDVSNIAVPTVFTTNVVVLKENFFRLVFSNIYGVPTARQHFPWSEFILAENLENLFNVDDVDEDDLPYLLNSPEGGKRKKKNKSKRFRKNKRKSSVRTCSNSYN
jgi:hypothetical protein